MLVGAVGHTVCCSGGCAQAAMGGAVVGAHVAPQHPATVLDTLGVPLKGLVHRGITIAGFGDKIDKITIW